MAYSPPPRNAVDFNFTVAGYVAPARNAVDFNFTEGPPNHRARLGISWPADAPSKQRAKFGASWPTLAHGAHLARFAFSWPTESRGGQLARIGFNWPTVAVAIHVGRVGVSWPILAPASNLARIAFNWETKTYQTSLARLWLYWSHMATIGRSWTITLPEEISRAFALPSPIFGPAVARSWVITSAHEGVARSWDLSSPIYTSVERAWSIDSKAVAEVSRGFTLPSPIADVNVVARAFRISSPILDSTAPIVSTEAIANIGSMAVKLIDVEVNNDEGQFGWTSRMTLARMEDYDLFVPETAYVISVGGEEYNMLLDSKQKPRAGLTSKSAVILGISPCAKYAEPRAKNITKTWLTAILASELAAELFPTESIAWNIIDWSIPAPRLSASNESPRSIMQRVLTAAGAVLECNKDGTLKVRYKYPISVPAYASATPNQIYTDSKHNFTSDEGIQLASLVNRIRILDVASSGFQDRIEFLPDPVDPTRGVLRVWPNPWRLTFNVEHTSLPIVSVSLIGIQTEQLTELVEVVGGRGSVSHPIHTIDSFEFKYADLGGIVADEGATEFATTSTELFESLVEITYTTRFVAYNAVAFDGAKVQFVVREPESA